MYGNDKTGCTIINRVFIIIFQCKKAICLTVYTHPIQSAMSHSDYFSASSFLLVSVWIFQSHLIIKAEDLKMFYAQCHWEAFLYFLKRFLFQKYSQAISISFYIKHAWKNFEETLETHFLGAHTVQTVLKQFWMLHWKCLYLFFPLLSFLFITFRMFSFAFLHIDVVLFSNIFSCSTFDGWYNLGVALASLNALFDHGNNNQVLLNFLDLMNLYRLDHIGHFLL